MPSIHEYLNVPKSWPVRENVKHEIVLMPNKQDIRRAKQKDPRACALHNAACRMFDIPNCAIGGHSAYIPQRDKNGKYYIARMYAPQETRLAIQKFDKTGVMPEGGFRFAPVPDSLKLEVKRKYQKKRYRAIASGEKPAAKRGPARKHRRPLRAIPTKFAA